LPANTENCLIADSWRVGTLPSATLVPLPGRVGAVTLESDCGVDGEAHPLISHVSPLPNIKISMANDSKR
ncbi:MAG: hypothetical protein EBU88_14085, partial [Acidobacteria bacterium]|nr:hypothetical protein [Acidobacteriota bacterium]